MKNSTRRCFIFHGAVAIRVACPICLLLLLCPVLATSQTAPVDSLRVASAALYSRGLVDSAAQLAYKAEALMAAMPDSGGWRLRARLYGELLGPIESKLNRRPSAHRRFLAAYKLYKAGSDTLSAAYGKTVLEGGKNAFLLGAAYLPQAQEWLQQARQFYTSAGNADAVAQATIAQGNMAYMQGNFTEALQRYAMVQAIVDTLPPTPNVLYLGTSVSNNMAAIYQVLGNYEQSAITGQKTLDYARRTAAIGKPTLAILLLNQASYEDMRGNVSAAKAILEEATDTINRLQDRTLTAELQKQWSTYYIATRQWSKGLAAIQVYFQVFDSLQQRPSSYAGTRKNLAVLYLKAGDYLRADSTARLNMPLLCGAGQAASFNCLANRQLLAEAMYRRGMYERAADSLIALANDVLSIRRRNIAGLSEQDQLSYAGSLDANMQLLFACIQGQPSLFASRATAIGSLQLARKATVLTNWARVLQVVRSGTAPGSTSMYEKWKALRQQLATTQAGDLADSLQEQLAGVERSLARLAGEPAAEDLSYDKWVARQQSAVFIDFVRIAQPDANAEDEVQYAAVLMGPLLAAPVWVSLCHEKQLLRLLQSDKGAWLNPLQLASKLYTPTTAASALYRLLWQPLEPLLAGQSRLVVSATGLLNNISMAALWDGKRHLIQRFAIRHQFSFANLSVDSMALPFDGQVWAHMDYGKMSAGEAGPRKGTTVPPPAMQQLSPGTKPLVAIQGVKPATWLPVRAEASGITWMTGAAATEEAFVQQAGTMQGLLLMVTHGFYLAGTAKAGGHPQQQSALAMSSANSGWMSNAPVAPAADGMLTAYEIAALDLSKVQLAALTACETALGESTALEGNMGLVRAFKVAGVQKVLGSLWPVPAKATNELMLAFYTLWKKLGSPSAALRQAQLDLAARGYPPFYWAGWVLVE